MEKGFWVFGYGSLLWDPGFAPERMRRAVLTGYRRSFCLWSIHHRGTPERPGLVLALDRAAGGSCRGIALKVGGSGAGAVLTALRERELVSAAYLEKRVRLPVSGEGAIEALVYVVDREHPQYCRISPEEQARTIAAAAGGRGNNREYLEKTVARLRELEIEDPDLESLLLRVRQLTRRNPSERSG